MLTKLWNELGSAGVHSKLDPSSSRYIILTNRFGIISGLILLIVLNLLLWDTESGGWNATRIVILSTSLLFFSIVLLNRFGHNSFSKWMISWLPTILIVFISISDKVLYPEFITIQDFFSYRFMLLAMTIIPLLIFSTRHIKILLVNLLPSFFGTVFFDDIHKPFGVSFSQFGFEDPYFYLLNVVIALAYFALVGFLLSQRFVTDRFEIKLYEQQQKLLEKNNELNHLNAFVNEQNHETTVQSDRIKGTNERLLEAKHTIEQQQYLLEDQNKNLEKEVLKKTKDLSRVNEELIINNSELRQFSHTLSHNLKSPVATFQGLLNLVDVNDLNIANRELLRYLNQTVDEMQGVFSDLNEMLELRKQLYTSNDNINVQKEIDDLHSHFYHELRRNNISFNCNCNGVENLFTNEKRLNGILFQLISNSIKFRSSKRNPEIILTLNGNDEYHSIKIRDNGLGIDLNKYGSKLFYPYQKFHEGIAGKGLGLYLVKLQAESLGGKVNISSKLDEFTEVEVLLKK